VVRGYSLPAYARGPRTLVIGSSYSGNTEETLAAFEEAHARGAKLLAVTSGGRLAELARAYGAALAPLPGATAGTAGVAPNPAMEAAPEVPAIPSMPETLSTLGTPPTPPVLPIVPKVDRSSPASLAGGTGGQVPQPRAVVGYSFILLLGVLCRLGVLGDKRADLDEAVDVLRMRWPEIEAGMPAVRNPAKRLAGQLVQRIPVIYGAGALAPVAMRWKTQLNENAKTWAGYEALPELNHNAVVGIMFPQELMTKVAVVMLTAPLDPPRIRRRFDVTRELLMHQGIAVDVIKARGHSLLANVLSALHFGDYVSYYLAMAYQVDPSPVPPIDLLKEELAKG
jgi:hypothetical protein